MLFGRGIVRGLGFRRAVYKIFGKCTISTKVRDSLSKTVSK